MMRKNKFLLGGALILGVSAMVAMVTHEIKQKKEEKNEVREKERMYRIDCTNNECFGYDSEDYNCKKETDKSLDIMDDYHNYSKE